MMFEKKQQENSFFPSFIVSPAGHDVDIVEQENCESRYM